MWRTWKPFSSTSNERKFGIEPKRKGSVESNNEDGVIHQTGTVRTRALYTVLYQARRHTALIGKQAEHPYNSHNMLADPEPGR